MRVLIDLERGVPPVRHIKTTNEHFSTGIIFINGPAAQHPIVEARPVYRVVRQAVLPIERCELWDAFSCRGDLTEALAEGQIVNTVLDGQVVAFVFLGVVVLLETLLAERKFLE